MKIRNTLLPVSGLILAIKISQGQNYKVPNIDASGKIMDKDGKPMGSMSIDGATTDELGMKIAHIDATGTLVDEKTGKKLG